MDGHATLQEAPSLTHVFHVPSNAKFLLGSELKPLLLGNFLSPFA